VIRSAWSHTLADRWDTGIIAGTGVIGAIVHGTPSRHIIALSHERFFLPANSRRPAPDIAGVLTEVRLALAAHDELTAADVIDATLRAQGWDPDELIWTDPLAPAGEIVWTTPVAETADYRRQISLVDGSAAISWAIGDGTRAGLRILAVHGSDEVTLELWSDEDLEGGLTLQPVAERSAGASTVVPVDYGDRVEVTTQSSDEELVLVTHARGAEPGEDASAVVSLTAPKPQELDDGGWHIRIRRGDPVQLTVRVTCGAVPAGDTFRLAAAALLERCQVSFGASPLRGVDGDAVEVLWEAARHGDPAAEAGVIELAFAAGRRNVLASTGELPPTLQGVWQGTWSPAWSADYTMNGNLQLGALAAALWTGMPEIMPSLFRLVRSFAEDFRSNARRIYGRDGMLLPARLTTHGHANHFLREYPHEFWLGNGPWLLRMAADYIQVTGDTTPIDDWLWAFAVEILEFSQDVLRDGGGILSPSYSPENTPTGSDNPLATNAAADIAALRDGFAVGAWLASLRGDDARQAAWMSARESLPEYRVAVDGTLAEWGGEWPEHLEHRHASQLQGLWYDPDPRLLEGGLRDAAIKTVRAKVAWRTENPAGPPGHMEMAFGLSSVGIAAAALGDSASAYQCALWLARDHFSPALTTTHDAGAIFNLDASGALPAVVAAMLVGSSPGHIRLLPALPRQWPAGRATGLGVRNGGTVQELRWSADAVSFVLELPSTTRWLRPGGVDVSLPFPVRLRHATGIRQVDDFTLHVAVGATAARADVEILSASDRTGS
jgi:alpha-L-fucosidase 2